MSHPVEALRALRGLLAEGGSVVVADERTAERFAPDAGDVERLYYGFSVLHCLPVGMVGRRPGGHRHGHARRTPCAQYADAAGFARCRGAADRERLLAVLPAPAVGPPAFGGRGVRQ